MHGTIKKNFFFNISLANSPIKLVVFWRQLFFKSKLLQNHNGDLFNILRPEFVEMWEFFDGVLLLTL